MGHLIEDKYFRVEVLSKEERPNRLIYLAMHQDYSEGAVFDKIKSINKMCERELGNIVVNRCVKYNHWGVIEHPSITLNVIAFPHSVLAQARTHRISVSFDCQSMRYTSQRLLDLAKSLDSAFTDDEKNSLIAKEIYLRPVGKYNDRNGNKYEVTPEILNRQYRIAERSIYDYAAAINYYGFSPEHARGLFVYDFRQNFVVTFNLRSILHFLDLRHKADAQLEIQVLSHMMFDIVKEWVPEIAEEYEKKRLGKNKLAP